MAGTPKCPRCGAAVTGTADDLGFLSCGGCGARLRKAPTVKVTIQSPTQTSSPPVPAAAAPPPTPTGNRDTDSTDSLLARIERVDASATLPPGLQSKQAIKDAGYGPAAGAPKSDALAGLKDILQSIQKDMATLKQNHQDLAAVVAKLESPKTSAAGAAPASAATAAARPKASPAGPRSMLIVDDDKAGAEELKKACEKLGFAPVVVDAVRAALDAMGRERPVVLVLEPLLAGELSGKDLVNYVKSTMEWIEIPILLHTRAEVANHEQARTDFGADDYVIKAEGSIDLVAKKAVRLTA